MAATSTEQALDFSMKRQKSSDYQIQPAESSSSSTSKHSSKPSKLNVGKLDTFGPVATVNNLSSLASIVYSPTSASFPGASMTAPVMTLDPTLMPTTSLALSTLYRRRRRRYSNDDKETSSKKTSNGTGVEKDEAYWERRRKNNQAAKRSRDARKNKEDEIALRAAFLEQENCKLKAEVAVLKNEMARLHCLLLNQMTP